jgi:hypothetical protein
MLQNDIFKVSYNTNNNTRRPTNVEPNIKSLYNHKRSN